MTSVGKKVAAGAAWMIGMRFVERSIGIVSTLILARLLVPEDFGLVAMAMAVFAFVEIAGQFGFDLALIREQHAAREHYDSAWTVSVCYGILAALILAALAIPAAYFFGDPRLETIIYIFGAVALLQGFENIGTVDFRKNLNFGKDFRFIFFKKIISFAITVALAFHFRSYWALVAGMAASRIAGVVLSYAMHPFRPRIDFSKTKALFKFSKWIVLTRVIDYFGTRSPDFMIGRFLDASALGLYRVGHEIATLPTSELIFPIMRAVFPGYATVAHDRALLARSFLASQAMIVTLALPAGLGIVLLAEPFVLVLLGEKWLPAVPVIKILGLYGAVAVFQATNNSIFNVLGVPSWATGLKTAEFIILLPAIYYGLHSGRGLEGVSYAILGTKLIIIPIEMALTAYLLRIGFIDRIRTAWRPIMAALAMWFAVSYLLPQQVETEKDAIMILALAIPTGMSVYAVSLLALWAIIGRPEAPEKFLMDFLRQRFRP
ncbi:lipopolysaccharide biosynthesis protein [Thauera butanivorans]|uniref:lipopolysaccharide biosynthesis protein n=1 Tax=Thauera butanivorans TaxID=86174 RepID=UPI003AB353EE